MVRREFISHTFDPAVTIRGTSIKFNNSCISKLEDVTYVQFLIHPLQQRLLIRPCDEGARDAVRWCVVKGEQRKSREITCRPFMEKLYAMMGWDPMYRYRLQGMRIVKDGVAMYLFDLQSKECFLPQKRDPATGRIPKAEAVLPEEWEGSFGMEVEEHRTSTEVDLGSGFQGMGGKDGSVPIDGTADSGAAASGASASGAADSGAADSGAADSGASINGAAGKEEGANGQD